MRSSSLTFGAITRRWTRGSGSKAQAGRCSRARGRGASTRVRTVCALRSSEAAVRRRTRARCRLFPGVRRGRAERIRADGDARGGAARVAIAAVALLLYALFLKPVGFLVCTLLLMLLLLRGICKVSWRASLLAALPAVALSYFLFTRLGVPLPAGVLAF